MRILWEILGELLASGGQEFTAIVARLARIDPAGRPVGEVYLASLRRVALVVVLVPLPLLLFGVLPLVGAPLAAIAGLFWVAATLLLAFIAAPLGMIVDAALVATGRNKERGLGARYVNLVLWTLLVESSVALFMSVMPLWRRPLAIPVLFLAAGVLAILGFLGKGGDEFRKWSRRLAVVVFAGLIISLFFPEATSALGNVRRGIDHGLAQVFRGEVQLSPSSPRTAAVNAPLPAPNAVRVINIGPQYTKENPFVLELHPNQWSPWLDYGEHDFRAVTPEDQPVYLQELGHAPVVLQPDEYISLTTNVVRLMGEGTVKTWVVDP